MAPNAKGGASGGKGEEGMPPIALLPPCKMLPRRGEDDDAAAAAAAVEKERLPLLL